MSSPIFTSIIDLRIIERGYELIVKKRKKIISIKIIAVDEIDNRFHPIKLRLSSIDNERNTEIPYDLKYRDYRKCEEIKNLIKGKAIRNISTTTNITHEKDKRTGKTYYTKGEDLIYAINFSLSKIDSNVNGMLYEDPKGSFH